MGGIGEGEIIRDFEALVNNGRTEPDRRARRLALAAAEAAVRAADPRIAIRKCVSASERYAEVSGVQVDLSGAVYVLGAGKATGRMAEAIEGLLDGRIVAGAINVLRGTEGVFSLQRIAAHPAGHPIPDEGTIEGTRRILELAERAGEGDVVFALISGGGSALMELPQRGISLEDLKRMNDVLIKSGATIQEINAVRKHVSRVKGGQLARAARPAQVVGLIVSDIVGDPVDSIASGPTAPDPTSFEDAWEVLEKYDIVDEMPESVVEVLRRGLRGELPETPKPGDEVFDGVHNVIVASNSRAVAEAARALAQEGVSVVNLGSFIEGEARHVGRALAGILQAAKVQGVPAEPPVAIVSGGETTVRVTGSGKGGRNQELVLGAVEKLSDLEGAALLSIGTDGIDGVTDAAGAIADGRTLDRALKAGMKPSTFLRDNNSYEFFRRLGDLILTGPTYTNVMDVQVAVAL